MGACKIIPNCPIYSYWNGLNCLCQSGSLMNNGLCQPVQPGLAMQAGTAIASAARNRDAAQKFRKLGCKVLDITICDPLPQRGQFL